ncbi:hypothetical protein D9619_011852 [Psilocybe cf. subviscida]|uniref:Extracellular membrane protein CFEM domain-containing protein n=1 Tax=Psilocybe cf. subviscida TaxID=2480587 RepID=A0A8H5B172_9AGAR|nr:hypothetical protein D9619_011852 [Psilocybe cf. subviscida]
MLALFFALFSLLAGRVFAQSFNFTFGAENITVSDALSTNFTASPLLTGCSVNITAAQTAVTTCAPNDAACLCSSGTSTLIFEAELCMLHTLIAQNKPAPDARAGSNVLLGAYAAQCNALSQPVPKNQSALTLPDTWVGPYTAVLPVPTAIVFVIFAGIFGVSALFILSNIE